MLNKNQLSEIREHLEKAQNPIFFFDNDCDGLCAFAILKRATGKGKGVPIKSYPRLGENSLRKIDELNSDYVFILDYSLIDKDFLAGVLERNLPLVIIDHHDVEMEKEILKEISYYNSSPSGEPTTYICQKIYNRKEDEWLALVGCITDMYKPEFGKDFVKNNSEIYNNDYDLLKIRYQTEIGKIGRMLNAGLKDTTTNMLKMIYLLEKANSPSDVLQENTKNKELHKKFTEINKFIEKAIKKIERIGGGIILLEYSGQTSISQMISDYLTFMNENKTIVVAFKKEEAYNISLRGKDIKDKLLPILEKIPNATGGGHQDACGARVPIDDFEFFKKEITKQ